MTTRELAQYIGKVVTYQIKGMAIECKIDDARLSYGQVHLLIVPTAGTGSLWVMAESVKFQPVSN